MTDNNGCSVQTRVLIVDDNRDAAQMLGALLELYGAEVRVEYNSEDALLALDEFDPRVLLIDLGMPGRDGLDLARDLNQRSGRARQTLVAVTGWGDQHHRTLSREAGFDVHLVKPVQLPELLRLLDPTEALRSFQSAPGAAERCQSSADVGIRPITAGGIVLPPD